MADYAKILVELSLQNNQYLKALTDAQTQTKKAAQNMTSAFSSIGKLVGIGTIALAFSKISKETIEAQKSQSQLEAVIKSTGGAAGVSVAKAEDYAKSLEHLTTIDNDVIKSAEVMLLRFTNIKDNIFPEATLQTMNLSAALGTGLGSSAKLVGKTLQDPLNKLTQLERAGVSFSAQQKQMITNFARMGDLASAQKIILGQLEKQYGGAAVAQAENLAGAYNRLKIVGTDAAKVIGERMTPGISNLSKALANSVRDNGVFLTMMQKIGDAIGWTAHQAAKTITILDYAVSKFSGDIKQAERDSASASLAYQQIGERTQALYGTIQNAREKALKGDSVAQIHIKKLDEAWAKQSESNQKIVKGEQNLTDKLLQLEKDYRKEKAKIAATPPTGYEKGEDKEAEAEIKKIKEHLQRQLDSTKGMHNEILKEYVEHQKNMADVQKLITAKEPGAYLIKTALQTQYAYKQIANVAKAAAQEVTQLISAAGSLMSTLAEEATKRIDRQQQQMNQYISMAAESQMQAEGVAEETRAKSLDKEIATLEKKLTKTANVKKKAQLKEELDAKKAERRRLEIQEDADNKSSLLNQVAMMRKNIIAKKEFENTKAMQLATAGINLAAGIVAAWAGAMQLGPIAGIILGAVTTALLVAMAGIQMAAIASRTFTPTYETGSYNVQTTGPAILHGGEIVTPEPMAEAIRKGDAWLGSAPATGNEGGDLILEVAGKTFAKISNFALKRNARRMGARVNIPVRTAYA